MQFYDDFFLLGGFEQAANSVHKNLKKPTGTLLDHRKLLNMYGFLRTRSIVTAIKNVQIIKLLASDALRCRRRNMYNNNIISIIEGFMRFETLLSHLNLKKQQVGLITSLLLQGKSFKVLMLRKTFS